MSSIDKNNDLIFRVSELEAEIKRLKSRKKFGLVWENKPEKFEKESQNALPVLKEKGGKFKDIITDKNSDFNVLIEGDNYHALSVLNYAHKKSIDLIYIDPPYNTGAKNWKYNNHFVDKDDSYRHSKWLTLMKNRLSLSKNLLKDDGILVCAIDENEQAHLSVLLEEMFSEYDQYTITIIHNPGGTQGNNFHYTHEYAIFLIPKNKTLIGLQDRTADPDIRPLRDVSTGNHLREDAKNCFYPVFVKDGNIVGFGDVCDDSFHPESANVTRNDGVVEIYPIDPSGNERKWVFARQSVESIKGELAVVENKKRSILDIVRTKTMFNYKTVWTDSKYNANIFGTKLLREVIPNCDFDFPKSLYTVYDCLFSVVGGKPDAKIIDFFAGSGTTGHAVLEMNKVDNGNRKFILCTNNENGICEDVTYERIKRVIKGYTNSKGEKIEGLGSNLKYLKTDFIGIDKVNDNLKKKMVDRSTEILCLKENTFNLVADKYSKIRTKIFENSGKYTAILFDLFYFDDFVEEISKLKDKPVSVYVFSYTKDFSREEFGDLSIDFTIEAIPEKILETYKKIFNF